VIRRTPLLALAFQVAFLAVGIPYWRLPYAQLSLPGSLVGPGLFVLFAAAGVARWWGVGALPAIALIGAAAPAAVLARIVFDTALDPTSHNLWPFELLIAAGLGHAAASAGALLGRWMPNASEPR
jgi:hypothetical protein